MPDRPARRPAASNEPPAALESITNVEQLCRELDRLRRRAAAGTGRARIPLDDIARRSGLPRSTVHAYLSGKHVPPPDALDAIVGALGISGDALAPWADALDRIADRTATASMPDEPAMGRSPAPRQLPAAPHGFVGRQDELAYLDRLLVGQRDDGATLTVAVSGPGGVGKSALIARWAHHQIDRFPDGQIWLDLHGFGVGSPMSPATALGRLIRAIRFDAGTLPTDPEARAELFRTSIAGRRMLIVLDNARDSAQLRLLLPGDPSATVVVSSRGELQAFVATTGAERLRVPRLSAGDSVRLLSSADLPVPERLLNALTRPCDGLPLALRILRERLAGKDGSEVQRLAQDLENREHRLAELEITEAGTSLSVRAVLAASYEVLSEPAAGLLRLLPMAAIPTAELATIEALGGTDSRTTRQQLHELVAANLLDGLSADRFRIHDLVAGFAETQPVPRQPADRLAADLRLAAYLTARLHLVCQPVAPNVRWLDAPKSPTAAEDFERPELALAWTVDSLDLVAAVSDRLLDANHPEAIWPLLQRAFWATLYRADHQVLVGPLRRAATLARQQRQYWAELRLRQAVGIIASDTGDHDRAAASFRRVVALALELTSPSEESAGRANLAQACHRAGQLPEARREALRAIELAESVGVGANSARMVLAETTRLMGDFDQAERYATDAQAQAERDGAERTVLASGLTLGWIEVDRGYPELSLARSSDLITQARRLLDRDCLQSAITMRVEALLDLGRVREAEQDLAELLVLTRGEGAPGTIDAVDTYAIEALVLSARGDHEAAINAARIGSNYTTAGAAPYYEAYLKQTLAHVLAVAGDLREARIVFGEAATIAERCKFGVLDSGFQAIAKLLSATITPSSARPVAAKTE